MSDDPKHRLPRVPRPDPGADVDDEFEFHVACRAAELETEGVPAGEAMIRARREFGDADQARRACLEIQRDAASHRRRRELFGTLRQDVRFAFRVLRQSPGFTAVAALTLALGLGGTTAIFSAFRGVLLRPLPYGAPERLVRVWEVSPRGEDHNVVSRGNYVDWARESKSFSELGAHYFPYGRGLTGDGEPVQVMVSAVTPSLMRLLDAPPLLGRSFVPEDAAGDGSVVLLSYHLWQGRFGGDSALVGRSIVLDDERYQVAGVMAPSFGFPAAYVDLWTPIPDADLDPTSRRSHNLGVVGRLAPGATRESAQAELDGIARSLAERYPEYMTDWGVNVVPLQGDLVADVRPLLIVLFGGIAVVLLIVCLNLSNLLLSRAVGREREMAVRGALGASRGRLIRQLFTESLILGLGGGVLGAAVAVAALRLFLTTAPVDIPLLDQVRLDPAVLAFAVAVTIGSVVLFGLVPAFRLARADLQGTLRGGRDGVGSRHGWLRGALLVIEVAFSLVLLVGAGLLVRSFWGLQRADYGFRPDNLLTMAVDLPSTRYDTTTAQRAFYQRLIDRLGAIPGVASVAGTSEPPGGGWNMTFSFAIRGRPAGTASGREDPEAMRVITPGYFRTMGIPLLRGRDITSADRADAPAVLMINQAMARLHWADQDPIGQEIRFAGTGPWWTIVGVAGDVRLTSADQEPAPALYLPYAQRPWSWMSWLSLLIRPEEGRDAAAFGPAARAAVWELDDHLPIQRIATAQDLYAEGNARRRFAMTLLLAFAGAALVLGAIGMYGVLSYTVAQRRQEIGIRVALGAAPGRVLATVLRQALALAGLGVAFGLGVALVATRLLRSLLYQVSPVDPITFAGVSAVIGLIAIVAAFFPARRAARVDPLTAIRDA